MVLLTHMHGDHYLGLIGLLKTYALRGRDRPLPLVGPEGLAARMALLRPVIGRLPFPVEIHEITRPEPVLYEDGAVIRAFPTHHSITSFGYAMMEEDRPGTFDVTAARALDVPEGPMFGALQRGESVTLDTGTTVRPDQVVGPARAGRRVVLTGDTTPTSETVDASREASVLVHEATFLHEEGSRARETRHSTAREAGEMAAEAGVAMLALTHLSMRTPPRAAREEAARASVEVVVPGDFDQIAVPFPERGTPRLHRAVTIDRPTRVAASTVAAGEVDTVSNVDL
jgi:ribonuclease Z